MELGLYHILNRGVDKRTIFQDEEDHFRFVHDLFEFNDENNVYANNYRFCQSYNQSLDIGCPKIEKTKSPRPRKCLVKIHAFSMMPNHYHLLISPINEKGVSLFMKKLNMGYSKYFNEKYERVGALFQGKYKSIQITEDRHFLFMPYYIHFNPLDLHAPEWRERSIKNLNSAIKFLESYRWSSHLDYLGKKNFPSVTQRDFFLDYFGGESGYKNSVYQELKNFSSSDFNGFTLE